MSLKHLSFSLGSPNETAIDPNGKLQKVRDELGLSLDPLEHADKSCRDCGGRGILVKIAQYPKGVKPEDRGVAVSQDGKVRFADTCPCVAKGYQRRRKMLRPDGTTDLRYPLGKVRG